MQKARTFGRSLLPRPRDGLALLGAREKTHVTDSRLRVSYFLLSYFLTAVG